MGEGLLLCYENRRFSRLLIGRQNIALTPPPSLPTLFHDIDTFVLPTTAEMISVRQKTYRRVCECAQQ